MRLPRTAFLMLAILAGIAPASLVLVRNAQAETCTREAARRIVDETGAKLRVLTSETQPKVQARLRELKEKRGWSGAAGDERAASLLSDDRTAELDSRASSLLARIDELAEDSQSEKIDCARLAELDSASLELQATVRAKSQHVLARLDKEISGDVNTSASNNAAPAPTTTPAGVGEASASKPIPPDTSQTIKEARKAVETRPAPRQVEPSSPPAKSARASPPASPVKPAPAKPNAPPRSAPAPTGWSTQTVERAAPPPPASSPPALPPPSLPPIQSAPLDGTSPDGFSKDEIAQASRGFFGTISGGLGSVIEHAFSTLGRPTGYVLGSEGGGAFIAGVRYGKGRLFMRDGSAREVYWHGPSIGYDVGAAGSKTLFLVYNLKRDLDIFSGFSGVDGSAYLVGGVGMTLLTDGKVVMAPIRSGLGLRLGASIGYIRFTARPTWNPF